MAGPVKGTWDGKDIELNDAATETTLLKLVEAVKKSSGSSGSSSGKSAEDAANKVKELGNQADISDDKVEDLGKSAKTASTSIKNAFRSVGSAISGLTQELLIGGNTLSDFSQHFATLANEIPIIGGVLGGALQAVTGLLDSQIENYRDLSNAGVVFGASLYDAQRAAADTNLTLDEFSRVIQNNSQELAMLGGTAGNGARRFAEISRIIKEDFGTQFQTLGMRAAEQAEFAADYLSLQARLGRGQRMTNEQLARGTVNYLKELDKLSKVTGMQREEAARALNEQMLDRRMTLLYEGMEEGQAIALANTLQMVESRDREYANALKDIIATNGAPISELGEEIMRTNDEIGRLAVGMRTGQNTTQEFLEALDASSQASSRLSDADRQLYSTSQAFNDVYGEAIIRQRQFAGISQSATQAIDEQQAQMTRGNSALLGFSARLTDLRNFIVGKLIDSGVFETLETSFNDLISYFTEGGGFEALKGYINSFSEWFSGFVSEIRQSENPMQFILDKIGQAWERVDISGMIWNWMFGGSSSSSPASSSSSAAQAPQALDGSDMDAAVPMTSSSDGLGIGSMFDNITDKLGTFATIIGAGGAVYLAIRGLQTLIGGFAAGPVALGATVFTGMLIGTGAAINLAGQGIDFAGEGIRKVAEGVERLSQVRDVANLQDVSQSLGAIGDAILRLGAGGVLDAIGRLFGSDSPLDSVRESVNGFGQIENVAIEKMNSVGSALRSLAELTNNLDGSKLEEYAESMQNLAEAFKELNEQLAETNRGAFGGGSGVSVASLIQGGQLGGMNNGSGSGSASSEQIERLNTTMSQLLTEFRTNNTLTREHIDTTRRSSNSIY